MYVQIGNKKNTADNDYPHEKLKKHIT